VASTDPASATSTNNDVFEVTLAEGEARRVSTGPENDPAPRYSPGGHHLAWRSMGAGYEANRQRVLVRDRERGGEVEWTRGFAGRPAAFTRAPDGKTRYLYRRAPWHGHEDIHAAAPDAVRPGSARLLAKELLASSGGRLSFTGPPIAPRGPHDRGGKDDSGACALHLIHAYSCACVPP
jgi:hypothetical protein